MRSFANAVRESVVKRNCENICLNKEWIEWSNCQRLNSVIVSVVKIKPQIKMWAPREIEKTTAENRRLSWRNSWQMTIFTLLHPPKEFCLEWLASDVKNSDFYFNPRAARFNELEVYKHLSYRDATVGKVWLKIMLIGIARELLINIIKITSYDKYFRDIASGDNKTIVKWKFFLN